MSLKLVQTFNAGLAERDIDIGIRSYLKRLNDEVYKEPIDAFVDDLLDLILQESCCISQNILVKYGIVSNLNTYCDTMRIIKKCGLKEGMDFTATKLASIGGRPAKVCHLSPDAFAICLMCTTKTHMYARFYSLLSKCIASYDKYRIELKERSIMRLAGSNTKLEQMVQTLITSSEKQGLDVAEMKIDLRELKQQNTTLVTGVGELKQQFTTVTAEIHQSLAMNEAAANRQIAAAADIAILPENPAKADSLLLLHLDDNKYAALRVQAKAVGAAIRKHRAQYPNLREILHLRDIPNGKYLWSHCRDALKDRIHMVKPSCTIFTLEGDATEEGVVSVLQELHAEPVEQATNVSTAAKSRVSISRQKVTAAETKASHVLTRVTTITETIKIADTDLDALLDEYLG